LRYARDLRPFAAGSALCKPHSIYGTLLNGPPDTGLFFRYAAPPCVLSPSCANPAGSGPSISGKDKITSRRAFCRYCGPRL